MAAAAAILVLMNKIREEIKVAKTGLSGYVDKRRQDVTNDNDISLSFFISFPYPEIAPLEQKTPRHAVTTGSGVLAGLAMGADRFSDTCKFELHDAGARSKEKGEYVCQARVDGWIMADQLDEDGDVRPTCGIALTNIISAPCGRPQQWSPADQGLSRAYSITFPACNPTTRSAASIVSRRCAR